MTLSRYLSFRSLSQFLTVLVVCTWFDTHPRSQGPRFFPDDPLQREPETQDASKVQEWAIGLTPDLLLNLFGQPGDSTLNQRAQNVNTADEVPNSSWFTNRIYARDVSVDEIVSGPNRIDGPAPGRWTVIRPKSSGVSPGFTVRDEKGEVWFLTFDARENPVAPTAAIAVATKLFWALGYNQVESYLTTVRPENLTVAADATHRAHGKQRPLTRADVDDVLTRASRRPDGSYRVIAGRAIPGRTLGGFRYHGTRPDDPNDIVPHEHRRELRALQVFGAWTNLVDMKAGNTLDTLIVEDGRGVVRHYLQDVGSSFGTGALAVREGDEGHEFLYEHGPVWRRFATFGLFLSPWQMIDYKEYPEVGKFEGRQFDPEKWRPRIPVAALRHARSDDTFWAALRVVAFSDDQIRAAARAGAFSDPAAEKHLGDVLIERRDKIGRVYFSRINPLVRFSLTQDGVLTFENPAVRKGFAPAPADGYETTWFRFDNMTGNSQTLGPSTTSREEQMRAATTLASEVGAYLRVSIRALRPAHVPWTVPVDVYFRRVTNGWQVAGVERNVAGS
jgi:hypothetical protein